MGNEQPKKMTKASKGQIDIASLKAKIHLEMCRDRKNQEIIKGEKQLVNKIRGKSRNKIEEIMIAQRVVNGLKYAQACNLLMSCAATLRSHAQFVADNQGNPQKIEPWLPLIYSLIYGSDQLGLSSLNEFKSVMRALNDPVAVPKHTNPQILQLLTPNPSPEELNIYMLEMSERNQIPLEQINMAGHQFTKDYKSPEQIALEKALGEGFHQGFNQGQWGNPGTFQGGQGGQGQPGGQGGQGGQGFGGPNGQGGQGFGGVNGQGGQGFNGGQGGQGGFGGGQGGQGGYGGGSVGQGGNQGGFSGGPVGQGGHGQGGNQGGYGGNQGGFGGGQGGQGGFGGGNPYASYGQPQNNENPYQSGGKSNINVGPNFVDIGEVKKSTNNEKPRQFSSYEDIIGVKEDPNQKSIYPSINPNEFETAPYKPYDAKGNIANPFERQSVVNVNKKAGEENTTPTISQILRDFK